MYKEMSTEILLKYFCVFLFFVFSSCTTKKSESEEIKLYLESSFVAEGIVKDWDNQHFFKNKDSLQIAILKNDSVQFFNLNSSNYFKIDKLPFGISENDRFVFKDDNNWACINDSIMIVKVNNEIYRKNISKLLPKGVEIQRTSFFDIWKNKNMILFPIVNYNDKYIKEKGFVSGYNYVGYWNFKTNKYGTFNLKYHQIYEDRNIDRPQIYLTVRDSSIIISEHYSPYISVINLNEDITNIELSTLNYDLKKIPRINSTSKESTYESILKIQTYSEKFGPAFYIKNNEFSGFVRFYFNNLEEKSGSGKFNSLRDKKVEILFLSDDLKENKKINLPSGRFYQEDNWFIKNDTLFYPKWLQQNKTSHSYIVDFIYFSL